jgi:mono/diheme cytochrome c family protein
VTPKIVAVIPIALVSLCAQAPSLSVWDGVYTADQAKHGESLYRDHCERCHGLELEGDDESVALTGETFEANWDTLPLGKLYQRIRRDMPYNDPGKLSPEVNAAVLAFILKSNGFPAGETELPHNEDLLNLIRFDTSKPAKK